jgi:hypothetical protein
MADQRSRRGRKVGVRPGYVVVPAELAAQWARLIDTLATDAVQLSAWTLTIETDDSSEEEVRFMARWLLHAGRVAQAADELGDAAMSAQLRAGEARSRAGLAPTATLTAPATT